MEEVANGQQKVWHAVYTRSRAEKKAVAELEQNGVECFLPIQRRLRQWSDRKKWVDMPLISGYLFVRVNRRDYDRVLQSDHIVGYVRFEGRAAVVPDNQIEYLKLMLKQHNNEVELSVEELQPGALVEVVAGPMIGMRGKLVRLKGKSKIAINLEQLGWAALTEIAVSDIIVVEPEENKPVESQGKTRTH